MRIPCFERKILKIKWDLMKVFVVEFETFSVGENLLTVRTEYSGSSRCITCSILLFLVKGTLPQDGYFV
jgi:hypothetical protein